MIEIDIPGFGPVRLAHLVSDFTGTLSVDGRLLPGVKDALNQLARLLTIHILTADTFGRAKEELAGVPCLIHILTGPNHDVQKEDYLKKLGPESVVAFGNGNNDRRMLKSARVGIAVSEGEGCAVDAILAADIHVRSALDGLTLLLNPLRCKATLRF
ncbi:MAG: HAD hydrolase family protein [Deltaproteobacteria bacterium]|nr:HAD hydrolase family protein [Deltaproteobacteria bacterium]